MDHADHVALIRDGVAGGGQGTWADLGSGTGAFTLALAQLLATGSAIISIDRDARALQEQERRMRHAFPDADVRYIVGDFRDELELPRLAGLVMANSLHFVEPAAQAEVVHRQVGRLATDGRFIIVEYDADQSDAWVPHPLSYARWEQAAPSAGLRGTRLIGRVPSRYRGAIYAAVSWPAGPGRVAVLPAT